MLDLLEPYLRDRLVKHGITHPDDLLVHSDVSLAHLLGVSMRTSLRLIRDFCPAADLWVHNGGITTGLPSLDRAGGLQFGWLVELFGEAGAGKTQLCFSIAARATTTHVFWIDSENSFRPNRILDMHANIENLSVCKCDCLENLCTIVKSIPADTRNIIIVDSIAVIAKNTSCILNRQKSLHEFAILCKKTNSVVICTNHVVADMNNGNSKFKPSLGNTWSHDVTCRICVAIEPEKNESTRKRWIKVIKAPHIAPESFPIVISSEAVFETQTI